jgi:hypothetical protein
MGTTYTTHTLRGAAGSDVLAFMRTRGEPAFVSSGSCGYTVVIDANAQGQGPWVSELAQELSARFACPVLAVMVHDDDVTCYELWNAGERRDTYDSMPGFAEPDPRSPEGGDVAELIRLVGNPRNDAAAIERILRAEHGVDEPNEYLFEHKRHADLVSALGLPDYSAGFGYEHLATSISAGQPLSSEFQSTGVPYEEPTLVVSTMNDLDADVLIEITRDATTLRLRDRNDVLPAGPDIVAQLRALNISASTMMLIRTSVDAPAEHVGKTLMSLHIAGFTRIAFANGQART